MGDVHATGAPCWVDLATPDRSAARAFYGAVLGWTFTEAGEGGDLMCASDGAPVAGIGPLREGTQTPSAWTPYLRVSDVATTTEGARGAGARVMIEPTQVGDRGHAAVITDPHGAVVGLWQPDRHEGFGAFGPSGTPCWFEVATRHGPAVRDFFADLFGLQHEKMPGMEYWTLHAAGAPRYGVLQMNAEWDGIDPHWMTYFAVADTDAAAARVTAAQGEVKHGPFDTPFGRIAVVSDPMGALFSIITPLADG